MGKYDKILSIALFIFEALYYAMIKALPEKAARYPMFVLFLLVALTLVLAVKSFIFEKTAEDAKPFADFKCKQFLFVVLLSAIYIFAIEWLGFFSATFIYLLATMFGLKTSIKWGIVGSLVFCIVIYLVFVVFLKVPVPQGILL